MRPFPGILCAMGVAACAMPPASGSAAGGPAPIAGTRWVGVVEGAADPRALPRLEFSSGGRLGGFTGCNTMSGAWTEEGGAIRFGPIIATKRFCMGSAGEVEKRVLAALGEGSRAMRSGDRLVVTSAGGERFEFSPAAAS